MTELSGPLLAPDQPNPPVDLSQLPPPPGAPPAAHRHRRRRWLIALAVVVVAVGLFLALRGGGGDGDAIDVPGGTVLVESVEVSDRYPPDCTPSPGCWQAEAGFEMVSVALRTEGDVDLGDPTLTVGGSEPFEVAIRTWSIDDEDLTLTFAVPEGGRRYVLHLPGAEPHEL